MVRVIIFGVLFWYICAGALMGCAQDTLLCYALRPQGAAARSLIATASTWQLGPRGPLIRSVSEYSGHEHTEHMRCIFSRGLGTIFTASSRGPIVSGMDRYGIRCD